MSNLFFKFLKLLVVFFKFIFMSFIYSIEGLLMFVLKRGYFTTEGIQIMLGILESRRDICQANGQAKSSKKDGTKNSEELTGVYFHGSDSVN